MTSLRRFYDSKPSTYFSILRGDILAIIQRENICVNEVLSVGCGAGLAEKVLAERFGSHVAVIEYDKRYEATLTANFETVFIGDASEVFLAQQFDLIIYADVLEHIADPWSLLQRHVGHNLRPGGKVLISVPNVQYYQVILGLLFGRFHYVDRGILDIGHLRFFTRASLVDLCTGAGLQVNRIYRKIRLVDLAGRRSRLAKSLSFILGKLSPLIALLRYIPIVNNFFTFKAALLCTKSPPVPEA